MAFSEAAGRHWLDAHAVGPAAAAADGDALLSVAPVALPPCIARASAIHAHSMLADGCAPLVLAPVATPAAFALACTERGITHPVTVARVQAPAATPLLPRGAAPFFLRGR